MLVTVCAFRWCNQLSKICRHNLVRQFVGRQELVRLYQHYSLLTLECDRDQSVGSSVPLQSVLARVLSVLCAHIVLFCICHQLLFVPSTLRDAWKCWQSLPLHFRMSVFHAIHTDAYIVIDSRLFQVRMCVYLLCVPIFSIWSSIYCGYSVIFMHMHDCSTVHGVSEARFCMLMLQNASTHLHVFSNMSVPGSWRAKFEYTNCIWKICTLLHTTPCPEKNGTTFFACNFASAGQFSKFFHQQT